MQYSRFSKFTAVFALILVLSVRAQELPAEYHTELAKIADLARRTELETALRILRNKKNTMEEAQPALHVLLNSRQEELVFLAVTKENIPLYWPPPSWAGNNLRLLVRVTIHTIELHVLSSEIGAGVERLSEQILKVLQRHGVDVSNGYEGIGDAYSDRGFDWLEKWLTRAKQVAKPGTEFQQMVDDSLALTVKHRHAFKERMNEERRRMEARYRADASTAGKQPSPTAGGTITSSGKSGSTEPVESAVWSHTPAVLWTGLAAALGIGWFVYSQRKK